MSMKSHPSLFGLLGLSLLLASIFCVLPVSFSNPGTKEVKSLYMTVPKVSLPLTDHIPISIATNTGLTLENGVQSGVGTTDDPFLISGWELFGNGSTLFGILLEDVDAHVVIENCKVENFTNGIYLDGCANITVRNCHILNSVGKDGRDANAGAGLLATWGVMVTGIRVTQSSDILVTGCVIENLKGSNGGHGEDYEVSGYTDGRDGSQSYGIYFHFSDQECNAENNIIRNITGGSGGNGGRGTDNEPGGSGGMAGEAMGISYFIADGSSIGNTISDLTGGDGGNGAQPGQYDVGDALSGGSPGWGGDAYGIRHWGGEAKYFADNIISHLTGGQGGDGGDGGVSYVANGGDGASSGWAGFVAGIRLRTSDHVKVENNTITHLVGKLAGEPGSGGYSSSMEYGEDGGAGRNAKIAGIELYFCFNVTLILNQVLDLIEVNLQVEVDVMGLSLESSSYVTAFLNHFDGHTNWIIDSEFIRFSTQRYGNYWRAMAACPDNYPRDGILDVPYYPDENLSVADYLPLAIPIAGDFDGDGVPNTDEYLLGLNPLLPDSDGDLLPDLWEIERGYNPLNPTNGLLDVDADGLTLTEEYLLGTEPDLSDTDGDGWGDGAEIQMNTNPLDGLDFPDEISGADLLKDYGPLASTGALAAIILAMGIKKKK